MDRANRPGPALEHYSRAIEKDSTLSNAFYNRGLLHYRFGRYREALPDFSHALRLKPGDQEARFYRARCHAALGEYDSAVDDYTALIAASPHNPYNHYHRGELYRLLGEYNNAFDDFEIALSFDNYMYWVYGSRARTWLDMDSITAALADCNTAISIAAELVGDLQKAGFNRYWNPQWPPGVSDDVKQAAIQQEIDSRRRTVGYYYSLRGSISLEAGDYDKAMDDFRTILQWSPDDARAYGNMGWTYYLQGDFERCITFSEIAVRYDGNALFARYNRALALLRLNRIGEARRAYSETIDYSDFLTHTGNYSDQEAGLDKASVYSYSIEAETAASAREGAIGDLRDLLAKNIQTTEVQAILRDLFGVRG